MFLLLAPTGVVRSPAFDETAGKTVNGPDEKEPPEQQENDQQRNAENKGGAVEDLQQGVAEEHHEENRDAKPVGPMLIGMRRGHVNLATGYVFFSLMQKE
jgi:hypothetical protein